MVDLFPLRGGSRVHIDRRRAIGVVLGGTTGGCVSTLLFFINKAAPFFAGGASFLVRSRFCGIAVVSRSPPRFIATCFEFI